MPKASKESLINDTKSSYYECAKCGYHTYHSTLSACYCFILSITHISELFYSEVFYKYDETNELSSYGLVLNVVIVESVIDVS